MTNPKPNPDPTIRGGQVNVPHPTVPTIPARHQPDTPTRKPRDQKRPPPPPPNPNPEPAPSVPQPNAPEETKNGTAPPS